MQPVSFRLGMCVLGLAAAGCVTRAVDVRPLPANAADFATWDCERIDDEVDAVQLKAADVAYAVDERAGNNVIALGLGVTIFWPAVLAMRPEGPESQDLARLKGRFEALKTAARQKGCPPANPELPAARAKTLPVAVGERLVYEDRPGGRPPTGEWTLRLQSLRRDEYEFRLETPHGAAVWRQDVAGNVTAAPPGSLYWTRLLKRDLALGQVVYGELDIAGDPLLRARVRGQVVAVGPQMLADRRFDVAVIDLYGDAQQGDASTRLDGAIVVDRASGVLLRLELRSALPPFNLQRRLARIER
jgi:hypothetical protein